MNTKQHNTMIRANFTLPRDLYAHFCAVIPKRQMSKVISQLMQKENVAQCKSCRTFFVRPNEERGMF